MNRSATMTASSTAMVTNQVVVLMFTDAASVVRTSR
jgi:hypothetical protein